MARPRLELLCALVLATACRGPHSLTFRIDVQPTSLRSRVSSVLVSIREGGCSGTVLYSETLAPGGPQSMRNPPLLAPGTYGFEASAIDTTCARFANVCDEIALPRAQDIELVMLGVAETPLCPTAECTDGHCTSMLDAGHELDSGSRLDGGHVDGGPVGYDTREPPYLACDSTYEDAIDPNVDFTGNWARMLITHRDGLCTDCQDEIIRLQPGASICGHFAFAHHFELLMARHSGAGSAVVMACGMTRTIDMSSSSGVAGFESWPADLDFPDTGECEFCVTAQGGPIDIRRFDLGCRTPTGPPVVSIRWNGMTGTVTPVAPATGVLDWSATEANSCQATDNWMGYQPLVGSTTVSALTTRHVFSLTCTNSTGTPTTASVDVRPM